MLPNGYGYERREDLWRQRNGAQTRQNITHDRTAFTAPWSFFHTYILSKYESEQRRKNTHLYSTFPIENTRPAKRAVTCVAVKICASEHNFVFVLLGLAILCLGNREEASRNETLPRKKKDASMARTRICFRCECNSSRRDGILEWWDEASEFCFLCAAVFSALSAHCYSISIMLFD